MNLKQGVFSEMENIIKDFDKLMGDSPIDDARRHQNKDHISKLVEEEISEAKSGIIYTDKEYRTHKVKEASISGIQERIGRWLNLKSDVVLRIQTKMGQALNSQLDTKEREMSAEAEEAKSQAKEEYIRNNHYSDLKSEHENSKNFYENMRAEMGGKPPVKPKLFVYLFVILMIGFIEWFVNYSTFNIKYPPGIAFGATVLIALAIAVASHFHGGLLKQRVALFAPHRPANEKRHVIYIQLIFSCLLFISLAVVTYNRYDVLQEQMVNDGGAILPGLAGVETMQSSIWTELTPFILLNLLVWLCGVAISYFVHDSRPDYQEAYANYNKAKSKFFKADKGLKAEERRIELEYEEKIKRLKNAQSVHVDTKEELNNYLERLNSKEDAIVTQAALVINDILEKHQTMLVTELRKAELVGVKIGPGNLSLDEYQSKDVHITKQQLSKALAMEAA